MAGGVTLGSDGLGVRKHRAPKGALRLAESVADALYDVVSQKAPSAKRCIKTCSCVPLWPWALLRQKAPSAKRCIKTNMRADCEAIASSWSESTERQKVH